MHLYSKREAFCTTVLVHALLYDISTAGYCRVPPSPVLREYLEEHLSYQTADYEPRTVIIHQLLESRFQCVPTLVFVQEASRLLLPLHSPHPHTLLHEQLTTIAHLNRPHRIAQLHVIPPKQFHE